MVSDCGNKTNSKNDLTWGSTFNKSGASMAIVVSFLFMPFLLGSLSFTLCLWDAKLKWECKKMSKLKGTSEYSSILNILIEMKEEWFSRGFICFYNCLPSTLEGSQDNSS